MYSMAADWTVSPMNNSDVDLPGDALRQLARLLRVELASRADVEFQVLPIEQMIVKPTNKHAATLSVWVDGDMMTIGVGRLTVIPIDSPSVEGDVELVRDFAMRLVEFGLAEETQILWGRERLVRSSIRGGVSRSLARNVRVPLFRTTLRTYQPY